jgi:hypothetical protein
MRLRLPHRLMRPDTVSGEGVKLRSHGSEMARPVYLQQRTYLMIVATAVECCQ